MYVVTRHQKADPVGEPLAVFFPTALAASEAFHGLCREIKRSGDRPAVYWHDEYEGTGRFDSDRWSVWMLSGVFGGSDFAWGVSDSEGVSGLRGGLPA